MEEMKKLWDDIAGWLEKNAPPAFESMKDATGATDAQLDELAARLGAELPEDFRAYLKIFNKYYGPPFFEYASLDIENIHRTRDGLNSLKAEGKFDTFEPHENVRGSNVRYTWWHDGWVPFAEDGGGNLICVDLDPADSGAVGQVFYWEIHGGPVARDRGAGPSFLDFVRWYRDELVSDNYKYDEMSGIFDKVR